MSEETHAPQPCEHLNAQLDYATNRWTCLDCGAIKREVSPEAGFYLSDAYPWEPAPQPADPNCPSCGGRGWAVIQGGNVTVATGPCRCVGGKTWRGTEPQPAPGTLAERIRAMKWPKPYGADGYQLGYEDGFYRGAELAARLAEEAEPAAGSGDYVEEVKRAAIAAESEHRLRQIRDRWEKRNEVEDAAMCDGRREFRLCVSSDVAWLLEEVSRLTAALAEAREEGEREEGERAKLALEVAEASIEVENREEAYREAHRVYWNSSGAFDGNAGRARKEAFARRDNALAAYRAAARPAKEP